MMNDNDDATTRRYSKWFWCYSFLAVVAVIVVGLSLGLVLGRDKDDGYDGPRFEVQKKGYESSALDAVLCENPPTTSTFSSWQTNTNTTSSIDAMMIDQVHEYFCQEPDSFAREVRINDQGNRIFLQNSALRGLTHIAVYEEEEEVETTNSNTGKWTWKATLLPPEPEAIILDWAIDPAGQRLAMSYEVKQVEGELPQRYVVVYQYQQLGEWTMLGPPLDTYAMELNRTRFTGTNLFGDWAAADRWGAAVDLSQDGTRLAVSAPFVGLQPSYDDPYTCQPQQNNVGAVRVFEYRQGAWRPIGNVLLGRKPGSFLGQSLHLLENSTILASSDSDRLRLYSYQNTDDDTSFVPQGLAFDNSLYTFFVPHVRNTYSTFIAASSDGKVVAVAMSDIYPDALRDLPYRGQIELWMRKDPGDLPIYQDVTSDDDPYAKVTTIYGDIPFSRLGYSIAIADDYTLVLGTGVAKEKNLDQPNFLQVYTYVSYIVGEEGENVSEGDKEGEKVSTKDTDAVDSDCGNVTTSASEFRCSGNVTTSASEFRSTNQRYQRHAWEPRIPSFGEMAQDGWDSVAIAANGRRIVASASGDRRHAAEESWRDQRGKVWVFDQSP